MKHLFIVFLMLSAAFTNANTNDLNFKSKELNQIVTIFNKFKPDLVATGKIDIAYCGTWGGVFYLKKPTIQEFSKEFSININTYSVDNINFQPLELEEEQEKILVNSILRIVTSNQNNLVTGDLLSIQNNAGVILNWTLPETAIFDRVTKEILMFGSSIWQDDCD